MDTLQHNNHTVRKLRKTSAVASFDCGDNDLNDFISNESLDYQKARLSVTYIYESDLGHVDGYISLANDRMSLNAYRDAIPFYEKNGFVALNTDDEDDVTRVLYFDLMDLED